ncbi:hypothetical protein O2W14_07020 [Modestobacter sp. VKM Ac-2986]|uniref:hypothetical protein n=1 Tax=Modestobacter sp. VKM Ac-2986 TaxID=3004140 RepID=UPI0022AA6990|nr:hypothetical protein [Modestobacter sp. VKM Ac-2986]MCZ2828579.1 hypothetical protein [Modestobacter sp. VKM Ac-2986]
MAEVVVPAETHGPQYGLHKYWARKPATVLDHHLGRLLTAPGVVVDPFCGSGVFLRQAAEAGHSAYGFDVNPLAVMLSSMTLDPPPARDFCDAVEVLLATLGDDAERSFKLDDGRPVRYVVHALVTCCPQCSRRTAANLAGKVGRRYVCICGTRLQYNLAVSESTRVVDVVGPDPSAASPQRELKRQQQLSAVPSAPELHERYSVPFVDNARTLTRADMRTEDLFTPRNFSLLVRAADFAEGLPDAGLREAMQMLVTSSVAQCSRLIADRGRMSGGGPAWTVPGYWVPPVHLETNPINHLRARAKRFSAGLARLHGVPARKGRVELEDARTGMRGLRETGVRADLVFLDPPYGDSVAYLEFSALWNAFLRRDADLAQDLSVSQRKQQPATWEAYEDGLRVAVQEAAQLLTDDGRLLVTFNSLDLRAWSALMTAVQGAGLILEEVTYQRPAVVSAKAQFSTDGSYQGDFYGTFRAGSAEMITTSEGEDQLAAQYEQLVAGHGPVVPRGLVHRVTALSAMRMNLDSASWGELDQLIGRYFSGRGTRLSATALLLQRCAPVDGTPRPAPAA